jgi:hypothetical protein
MVGIVDWGLQQIGDLGCPLGVRPAPALDALKGGPGIVCVCNQACLAATMIAAACRWGWDFGWECRWADT